MKNFIVIHNNYERTKKAVEDVIFKFENAGYVKVEKDPDFVLILGGDGTFLEACRSINYDSKILCIGINFGNLGYLLDISNEDIESLLKYLSNTPEEKLVEEYIDLLEVKFYFYSSNNVITLNAVNEIIFSGTDLSKIDLKISTNNGFFQQLSVSNMIVSTSIGSTGINKSNFGPVMLEEYPLLITSFNLPIKSSVTNDFISNPLISSSFNVEVLNAYGKLKITLDAKDISNIIKLSDVKRIELGISKEKIRKLNFTDSKRGYKIREKMIR